jgi:hypothetical protein
MRISSLVLLAVAVSSFAFAGDRNSLTTLGMGRTGVSVTRGTDALGINPANLAMPGIAPFVLSLVQTDVRISTELMSYDIYQKYFTGVPDSTGKRVAYPLTDADKNTIRSQMTDNPRTKISVDEMYGGISLQAGVLGSFGFGITDHAGATIVVPRVYFDLFYLQGLASNSTYNLDGTSFNTWWYREYNFSYGRKIPNILPFTKSLYVGAGVKLIRGYGIFQMTKNHTSITNSEPDANGINTITASTDFSAERAGVDFLNKDNTTDAKFEPFPDPVGKGTGLDFGVTAELVNGMLVSWSLTDIGSITWDKNVIETYDNGSYTYTGYSKDIEDSVKDIFKGKNRAGSSFKTSLPTVMHLGASMEAQKIPGLSFLPGHMILAFEYAQGFNESLGNTTKPRFSFGTEYRVIPLLPLRTGIVLGGDDKMRWAFGFGLDFWVIDMDFATDTFGSAFSPKSFNALTAAFGMKIRL